MQRRYWGTKGPKIVRCRPSKTATHEGTDLELDALADGEPVKGVTDKIGDMVKLCNAPYEAGGSVQNGLKFRCICRGETNVHRIPIINPGTDQCMDQSRDSVQW